MRKIAYNAALALATLSLAACGGSGEATEEMQAENAETMADEALAGESLALPSAEEATEADAAAMGDAEEAADGVAVEPQVDEADADPEM